MTEDIKVVIGPKDPWANLKGNTIFEAKADEFGNQAINAAQLTRKNCIMILVSMIHDLLVQECVEATKSEPSNIIKPNIIFPFGRG